jgi:hypothetical protein
METKGVAPANSKSESKRSDVFLAIEGLRGIMADQEIIFSVEEAPEGGYTARALGHAIFTQGETIEELRQMVRDAVNCHFEKENKPRLIRLHMVKDEVIVA